jgi:hypothetical protein
MHITHTAHRCHRSLLHTARALPPPTHCPPNTLAPRLHSHHTCTATTHMPPHHSLTCMHAPHTHALTRMPALAPAHCCHRLHTCCHLPINAPCLHSHLHLHAAHRCHTLTPLHACTLPLANLHPAARICTPHTWTCNRHAHRPRLLGGQISGKGRDRDLLRE